MGETKMTYSNFLEINHSTHFNIVTEFDSIYNSLVQYTSLEDAIKAGRIRAQAWLDEIPEASYVKVSINYTNEIEYASTDDHINQIIVKR